jgi:hypothetical protein
VYLVIAMFSMENALSHVLAVVFVVEYSGKFSLRHFRIEIDTSLSVIVV